MFWKRPFRTLNLIEVDKEALIHNVRLYQSVLPGVSICPVLKSNAYGHGLNLVGEILDPLKLDFFVVDSIYEAYQLRDSKIKTAILVLGYTFPENFKKTLPFHFTAFDEESLRLHAKLGHPIHIEVDTGMNRMGFSLEKLPQALEVAKEMKATIVGVFSHFATADDSDETELQQQEARFESALELIEKTGFNPKWTHIGNSAGSLKASNPKINTARLGISLYGVTPLHPSDPHQKKTASLKPTMQVSSTIIAVRDLKKGDKISYGYTFEAEQEMRIAVIPFGYYEGLPRSLSNNGCIEVAGESRPIVGRVCMNHTMVDVTGLDVKVGDKVLIYSKETGHPCSFNEQSKKAETIPYELMVRLSESVRRV